MKDVVRNTYDKIAEKYAAGRGTFNNDVYLEKFSSMLPMGATVLDVGCGSGVPIDSFLISRGFKVIGFDVSEKQIELARTKVPEAKYSVRDISELATGEFAVDAVVSFYAIFHTPRETHADLFKKFNSYLPVNGLMLVTMASTEWEGVEDDFYGEPMYESHYGPKENSELVRDAGFEILSDVIDTAGGEAHQVIFAKKTSQLPR